MSARSLEEEGKERGEERRSRDGFEWKMAAIRECGGEIRKFDSPCKLARSIIRSRTPPFSFLSRIISIFFFVGLIRGRGFFSQSVRCFRTDSKESDSGAMNCDARRLVFEAIGIVLVSSTRGTNILLFSLFLP